MSNKYFIFPLSAINDMNEENFKEKINDIISYSVISYSYLLNDISQSKARQLRRKDKYYYYNCSANNYPINKILSARENLNLSNGSLRKDINSFEDISTKDKSSIKVSLHKNLVFDIRDNSALNCNEFKVLCCIYSILGNGSFKLIRLDPVKRRYCGYYKKELAQNKDLISTKKINAIIKRLYKRKFFYRVTFNSRYTYYGYCFKFESEANFIDIVKSKIIEKQTTFKNIKFEIKKSDNTNIYEMACNG